MIKVGSKINNGKARAFLTFTTSSGWNLRSNKTTCHFGLLANVSPTMDKKGHQKIIIKMHSLILLPKQSIFLSLSLSLHCHTLSSFLSLLLNHATLDIQQPLALLLTCYKSVFKTKLYNSSSKPASGSRSCSLSARTALKDRCNRSFGLMDEVATFTE